MLIALKRWCRGAVAYLHGTPVEPPPPELVPEIVFRPDDDMMKRASNIWRALGFVNDRFGSIPQIAGYLSMYRDWDNNGQL